MVTHAAIFAGFFFGGFIAIIVAFLLLTARDTRDYKNRKRKYEQERERADTEFRRQIARLREVSAAVERQRQDQPAVTVPVTHCERQDRRRVIKLYHDLDR